MIAYEPDWLNVGVEVLFEGAVWRVKDYYVTGNGYTSDYVVLKLVPTFINTDFEIEAELHQVEYQNELVR